MAIKSNLRQFNSALRRFARDLGPEHVVPFQKKVTLTVLSNIVTRTPVDTGRARGNWLVSLDTPSREANRPPDPQSEGTISAGLSELASLKPFQTIWISNNLPYIEALEDGHSRQAPNGMVAVTLAEISDILR